MDKRAEDLESDLRNLVEVTRYAIVFAKLGWPTAVRDLLSITLNEDRYLPYVPPYLSDAQEQQRAESFLRHARINDAAEWDSKP